MLEIKNLTKKFKKKTAVNGLSVSLNSGIYGLLGSNGAGKTTMIRCLTNLYQYEGSITWNGIPTKKDTDYIHQLGYLPQKFGAYRELSVEENLSYFCVLKKIPKEKHTIEINRVLEAVNLLEAREQKAKNLSGGMLRRLGIAQALLGDPKIIIFDEPTAGLDPEERLRFKMIVSSLSQDKIILISTHIVEDIDALCNQIIIMKSGNVVFSGDSPSLKAIAAGKVYECNKEELKDLKGTYFIEKQFEQNDEIRYRLITNEAQNCKLVNAKIEDGYLCISKNI